LHVAGLAAFTAALLSAAQQAGSVRAADQFIPGATLTATQGDRKVVGFTDADGRYSLNLAPGVWDIQVEMLGFTTVHQKMTVGAEPVYHDWILEMPRMEGATSAGAVPNGTGRGRRGFGQGRGGRGATPPTNPSSTAAPQQRPGFQSAAVTPTQAGQQALADAANQTTPAIETGDEADDAFLVNGSTSGGLGQSSDDENQRQRAMAAGRGGAPGMMAGLQGSSAALGLPPGMTVAGSDGLGLGGLGTSAINGGFTDGLGGGPPGGPGGPGGPGFGGGGRGGPGGGGGGGGGRGGGRGGRGGNNQNQNRRGPYNGQFSSFGNRRRNAQPAYTGSVFITLANSALNAAPFSLNGQSSVKPSSDNAHFGVNVGGPMVIPKLLNWKRAAFYFTYQGVVSRNPYSQVSSVPTLAERDGDFSLAKTNTPVTIYDPLNGMPFAGNIIPPTRLNPVAVGLLQYIPLPTFPGTTENYRIVTSTPNNTNNVGIRLNAPLNNKDRINFNVQYQNRDSASEQLFGFRDPSSGYGVSASAGWSHSFAPRFNNSATLTFSRNDNTTVPYFAYTDNVAETLGITGTSQAPINYGPPNLSFTNFGSLSDSSASVTHNQTTNFTDSITYVLKKKHNLTFGYLFRKLDQNSNTYQNARGSFSFSGLLTSQLNSAGQPMAGTGFDFADFLLGLPQSSSLRFGSDDNYFRGWATSAYAQDDFRISRGLSINFGLRYEYFAPYTEERGNIANLILAPGFTSVEVVTPATASQFGLPSSLLKPDRTPFSPRFGVAWRPSAKSNIVLRTGYSIFYSGSPYGSIVSQMASQPPFAKTASISTSPADPLTLENGFALTPSQTITNTYAINPYYRLPYAQTWVAAVQNTFKRTLLVELEYIGTKGTDLGVVEEPNRAPPGAVLTAQEMLQICDATGFNYQTTGANSIFNAGQVRVTRRFARGMSAVLLYTRSKSIDNASSFTGTGGTTVQFIDNWNNERGLSTFDQRNKLTLTYLLSSPVGVHGMMRNGGWKTAALAGWTLNGTFTAASGLPLTATVAGNLSNTGGIAALGSLRAEATGLPIGGSPFFNEAAFTTPPAGEYGDAGRDTIPGPFQISLNAAINRAFRFAETRRTLQLRLSAANALNHPYITGFGTTVNSATFGLPTSVSATRTVSLLLRFSF
jgi:hypothetical protein